MNFKLLKRSRVILSLLILIATFFVFVDLYEIIPQSLSKTILYPQFIPSLLLAIKVAAISSLGFIFVIILTIIFGRIYCSTICPLGILQDVISWITKKRTHKKHFYKFKKGSPAVRYSILGLAIIALIFGFTIIITLLDPYSIAGRFFAYLFKPLAILGNNVMAGFAEHIEWYAIYKIKAFTVPAIIIVLNLVLALTIGILAYKRGRWFCNTICPVGTFLGLTSKLALIKIKIDPDKCTLCSKCAGVCKSECINLKKQTIDYSRCVSCYNCLTVCNDDAINYKLTTLKQVKHTNKTDNRREAILGLFLIAGGIALNAQSSPKSKKSKTGKTLVPIKKEAIVTPPGSENRKRFNNICTACGLCVSSCPTKVLKPALTQYGLDGFMQPFMNYSEGECSFDCTICSNICPTGALIPLDIENKHVLQLGKAKFVKDNCIVFTDETACGACSEHCPTKAVNMVPYKGKLLIPEVNQEICVGCGACEHPCPLEPEYKAIYIDGNPTHLIAKKPKEEVKTDIPKEDFPF